MVRDALIQLISKAIDELVEKQVIDPSIKSIPIEIEPPKQADHGDFATNFCLVASKTARTNPRALAETLLPAILDAQLPLPKIGEGQGGVDQEQTGGTGETSDSHSSLPAGEEGQESGPNPQGTSAHEIPSLSLEGISNESESSLPKIGEGGPDSAGSGGVDQELPGGTGETSDSHSSLLAGEEGQESGSNPQGTSDQEIPSPSLGRGRGGVEQLSEHPPILSAEIAGPGFINFRLNPAWAAQFLTDVLENPGDFYKPKNDSPQKINVEFVSVNPNGPITIGSGRGAAFGSALCNVLEAAGNTVHREYYINDGVNSEQMRLFAESVKAIIEGRPVPDNGYKGDYVHKVANSISSLIQDQNQIRRLLFIAGQGVQTMFEIIGNESSFGSEVAYHRMKKWYMAIEASERVMRFARGNTSLFLDRISIQTIQALCELEMIRSQESDLLNFQVNFDTWFSEQSLHDSAVVEQELHHLLATQVADDERTRTKVVFAKGGQIKEVLKEAQPNDEEKTNDEEVPPPSLGGGRGGVDEENTSNTIWLRSTKFGDDQDRVLKRADGRLTYIASDVAYHKDKFNRPASADKLITVLGPDHHGYIARLTAVVAAMFSDQVTPLDNPEPLTEHEALIYSSVEERNQCQAALAWAKDHLEVQIFQIVRFLKDGKPAPMRKRDGNIYALIDLINEIGETLKPDGTTEEKQQAGSDVARFFYLMRHHDTAMDFDLELATKQSDENPVFYVQYAHARICSVIDKAVEQGISLPIGEGKGWGHSDSLLPTGESLPRTRSGGLREGTLEYIHLLQHPKELALILKICDLQNEVARTAEDYSVNRLTTYAIELARTYHSFYDSCRVIQPEQPELSQARLALCEATRTALRAALELLGVSAPNRMDRAERPA